MWFWEVLYEDSHGTHSIFSLRGYPTEEQARQFFDASELRMMQEIQNREGVLVDIQIIYKSGDTLYDDPDEVF